MEEENKEVSAAASSQQASKIEPDKVAKWYVAHTYSGYENKVKANLEKTINNRHLQDVILEVRIPMEDVLEIRKGQKQVVQRKLFPGYVLVHMFMNDDTWYIVRNTRGVTGFVGPGSKPVPLTESEMTALGVKKEPQLELGIEVGDTVKVTKGTWKDHTGIVQKIDMENETVSLDIGVFGHDTPVELSFTDVKVEE
jgi:transcriptional antiterminator NusG